MKKKNKLYIAVPGSFDPTLTNLVLTPMEFDGSRKAIRAIKKELKYGNVVLKATENILQNIKLPFIYVNIAKGIENMWFYRQSVFITEQERYNYPLILVRLNMIVEKRKIFEKISLVKTELLHEFLERVESND